jgi:CubicO group peptidase (beta-lactamase class C family)
MLPARTRRRSLLMALCWTLLPALLYAQAVFPGVEWERHASPEAVGWSSEGLAQVTATLSDMPTTGLMAIVGGRVLYEYGDIERVSYLASVRKSILSMLIGIYRERGVIDLSRTLAEMGIDDHQGLTEAERQATMLHLLTARSGVFHPASNAGDDLASAPARGSRSPGSYYLYSNWDFNALGTAFERQAGIDIYDALEQELARPLGFQDFDRASHRKSGNLSISQHPAYHMNLSARDMARVGYVMLREGRWHDRQVIPTDYVRESTQAFTPRTEMNPDRRRTGPWGYGYLWWVFDNPELPEVYDGAYIGLGAVGQHILVMPALDLVVVHKTAPGGSGSVSHERFLEVLELLLEAAPR